MHALHKVLLSHVVQKSEQEVQSTKVIYMFGMHELHIVLPVVIHVLQKSGVPEVAHSYYDLIAMNAAKVNIHFNSYAIRVC
jgi:hypothetical protein